MWERLFGVDAGVIKVVAAAYGDCGMCQVGWFF